MTEKKKTSSKLEKLVDEIASLSVLELSELTSALQEKLGVSATLAASAPAAATAVAGSEAQAGTTTVSPGTQTIVMTNAGANKIAVIKAIREINPNLGLKEAKDMTEQVPVEVLKDAKAEDAKLAADKLRAAGATLELK